MNKIFKDLKIVELASILAGPLVGSFFAEMGAHVVKIENKLQGGDSTRQWRLPNESTDGVSSYYAAANVYKESLFIDFTVESDYNKVKQLIESADIVITNFQKKTAEKLKVSIDTMTSWKEDLIIAQLNAYSYDDPRPGFDMVVQAEAGFISMSGTEEGIHTKMPVAMMDIIAAHQMKEAILISLIKKLKEGKGSTIHVSLYKSGISALANQASNYLMENHVPKPMGMLHPNIAPYGEIVTTRDEKSLILAIGSDSQFEKLGKTLNLEPKLLSIFKNNKERVIHRSQLHVVLKNIFSTYESRDVIEKMKIEKIPFALINNLAMVFNSDIAKEMVIEQNIDNKACRSVSNIAFSID